MNDIPYNSFDVEKINKRLCENANEIIFEAESRLDSEVERAADFIFKKGENLKIVLVSGRSASGKTTFTKKVCERLCKKGRDARHIALDDFLLGTKYLPLNEDGTYDMESIKGLDTALASECFKLLLKNGKADFPTFDFPNQRRGDKWNHVVLDKKGIIMIEGIHALNPILTEKLSGDGILKMFIEAQSGYNFENKSVFSKDEVRLMRRMTRDELFRGWSAEKTFAQWKSVVSGEKIYIEPYVDLAEIKVNTSMEFEPAVFSDVLSKMLEKIERESPFFEEARLLLEKLALFEKISTDFLPKDSLLREFVG